MSSRILLTFIEYNIRIEQRHHLTFTDKGRDYKAIGKRLVDIPVLSLSKKAKG